VTATQLAVGPSCASPEEGLSAGSLSSTKITWVWVLPVFLPECSCAPSQRAVPTGISTSTEVPPDERLRLNELSVTMTLSGCSCGTDCAPGSSTYSSTRTRSFSKITL